MQRLTRSTLPILLHPYGLLISMLTSALIVRPFPRVPRTSHSPQSPQIPECRCFTGSGSVRRDRIALPGHHGKYFPSFFTSSVDWSEDGCTTPGLKQTSALPHKMTKGDPPTKIVRDFSKS